MIVFSSGRFFSSFTSFSNILSHFQLLCFTFFLYILFHRVTYLQIVPRSCVTTQRTHYALRTWCHEWYEWLEYIQMPLGKMSKKNCSLSFFTKKRKKRLGFFDMMPLTLRITRTYCVFCLFLGRMKRCFCSSDSQFQYYGNENRY